MKKSTDASKTDENTTSAGTEVDASSSAAPVVDAASGAITDEATAAAVDTSHPAIDSQPREGTSVDQNARDMNDTKRRKPNDRDFSGQGIDPTPYGKTNEPPKKKKK